MMLFFTRFDWILSLTRFPFPLQKSILAFQRKYLDFIIPQKKKITSNERTRPFRARADTSADLKKKMILCTLSSYFPPSFFSLYVRVMGNGTGEHQFSSATIPLLSFPLVGFIY